MRKVNPPLFSTIPREFTSHETRTFLTNIGTTLRQLYEKLGGQVDPIQDVLEIDADTTTTGFQTFICTNGTSIDLTLNTDPADGETVHVKVRDAQVTIVGTIDGTTNLVLATQYDSATLVYLASEWSII